MISLNCFLRKNGLRVLICVLLILLSSCSKNKAINISDSNSADLSPGVDWAVIHEPYAAIHQEPAFDSPVVSHARRGEILQIMGNKYIASGSGRNVHTVVWYCFESGWIDESLITICDNKFKAQTISKSLAD